MYVGYPRIDGRLFRVYIEQRENDELTEFLYRFTYYEDGSWPSAWTSAGIPAPTFTAIPGVIDMNEFNESIRDYGSYSTYIKLWGANLSNYASTLRANGFTDPEYSSFWGSDNRWELTKQVQINGQSFNVSIEERENDEIPEIYISFRRA